MKFLYLSTALAMLLAVPASQAAFVPRQTTKLALVRSAPSTSVLTTPNAAPGSALQMAALDPVTYLRTEWVSAALCTNQTPRSADVCLQLGVQDGRAVMFIPRTIRELITSTCEADGTLPVSVRRQLKQQQERRNAATVKYVDQRADDLKETADESVDVVISLQAAEQMKENGLSWKKSIREAARVLKPGGRFLFVERTEIDGESYLEHVETLISTTDRIPEKEAERVPIFDDVGFDPVDMVLTPHIAGVAIKSIDAGLSAEERAKKESQKEKDRLAELSIEAYERGIKKRRKKKDKKPTDETAAKTPAAKAPAAKA